MSGLVIARARVLGSALLLAGMGLGWPVHAADLGTIGPVYPIAEPDMLDEIQATLQAKQVSGEIGRLQQKAFKRMRSQIETPAPVPMLVKARRARGWEVDPSVRFDEPIVDHEGRVVIPAGTLANPLAVVRLSSVLLFIDGRDRAQVDAAKRFIDRSPQPVKPILTAGSPVALSRAWQRPVYFDQAGSLVQRFGIQAVPARVSQAGQVLSVKEFPVEEFPA